VIYPAGRKLVFKDKATLKEIHTKEGGFPYKLCDKLMSRYIKMFLDRDPDEVIVEVIYG
jgi:hypothetical protein